MPRVKNLSSQSVNNMTLPAGILPSDPNIEIYANPDQFGKCYFTKNGQSKPFHELPISITANLHRELSSDKKAVAGLRLMGVAGNAMVEHYNFCNRGKLDSVPDITPSGRRSKEFYDCGKHGKCIGEGKVCSLMGLTFREMQCLRLNNAGKDYAQIRSEMGFKNNTAVNSLMSRLRIKLDAKSKTELITKSQEIGIL